MDRPIHRLTWRTTSDDMATMATDRKERIMSAYIVRDEIILAMVSFAHGYTLRIEHQGRTYRGADASDCQALVDALIAENYASVNHRYHETTPPHAISWVAMGDATPDAVDIVEQVREYDYHACEHPGYTESLAHAVVAALTKAAEAMHQGAQLVRDAAHTAARDAQRDQLLAQYAHLETETAGRAGTKLAAANIRRELRAAFPGVKFSVRVARGSMLSAVDVRWTDGPSESDVAEITGKYRLGRFDGMTDCYEHSDAIFPRLFGGAQYVSCRRDETSHAPEDTDGDTVEEIVLDASTLPAGCLPDLDDDYRTDASSPDLVATPCPDPCLTSTPLPDLATARKIAAREHEERGRDGGVVVVYGGAYAGWMNSLRDPAHWMPGCIAVDLDCRCWEATGGNDDAGALWWVPCGHHMPYPPHPQPLQPMDEIETRTDGRRGRFVATRSDGMAQVIWDDGGPDGDGLACSFVPRHLIHRHQPRP
jgi:hypothetical protein